MTPRVAPAASCALLAVATALAGCPTDLPDDPPPGDELSTVELVWRLAGQWVADEPADEPYWDWMDAVYMVGVTHAGSITGDPAQQAYPGAWVDHYYAEIESGERYPDASDRVAPNIVPVLLMERDGVERYPAVIPMVDDYLATVPRTDDGAVLHWGTHFPDRHELLIDTMFMVGGYLVAAYRYTGDTAYLDEFELQLAVFVERCRDEDEGLFLHAWDDEAQQNIPAEPVYWARGNAWIIAVTGWYLAAVDDDRPGRADVEQVFGDAVDGFVRYQDASGLVHTVLNHPEDPDNYLETSATALFLHGGALGLRHGVLEPSYRPALVAAHDGVLSRLEDGEDGRLVLVGTSFGTNPASYDIYIGIPQADDLILGVGAALMGLAAADGI